VQSDPPNAADVALLHDAELHLVCMDRSQQQLKLSFNCLGGGQSSILFCGTRAYKITEIRSQNVASRIMISSLGSDFDGDIEGILRWIYTDSSNIMLISEISLKTHLQDIISGDLHLLYIDPSCGAEIGVIAKTISLGPSRSPNESLPS
jgi:hypothetical protein